MYIFTYTLSDEKLAHKYVACVWFTKTNRLIWIIHSGIDRITLLYVFDSLKRIDS